MLTGTVAHLEEAVAHSQVKPRLVALERDAPWPVTGSFANSMDPETTGSGQRDAQKVPRAPYWHRW